ncbi:uncharacterized protein YabE (DUF348 family) [Sediminihabitans luteus]|uniref:Uncharacterized protein YabE (DUF348 family) n=1 Tax=Sediminihabitans luteus TaxID=1138585 RepID=A0A2M9CD83_9CELL|nr:ubiquitin-like domain-containing protein [Sediminihabitans luteus]PJJ69848.1 uncharacterized protein YabE (DUF348 family) [Sediminihabitans luteus]GIJ00632.1 hypothetical protein Slu03_30090 [Sediminihabitans luteus]
MPSSSRRRSAPGRGDRVPGGIVVRCLVVLALVGVTGMFSSMHRTVTIDYDGDVRTVSAYGRTVDELLESQGVEATSDDLVVPALGVRARAGETIVVRSSRDVEVQIDGRVQTMRTTARTVGEFLTSLGPRGDGALVSASRSDLLGRSPLRVATLKQVHVVVDGTTVTSTTSAPTVAAVLEQAGITLGADDVTSVPRDAAAVDGMVVVVGRASSDADEVTEVLPFETIEEENDLLPEGYRTVVQTGRVGEAVTRYEVRLVDGEEVGRDVVEQKVTVEPRDEIVRIGTMKMTSAPVSPGSARAIAKSMAADRGWGDDQFACLDKLWNKESGWNVTAHNASSGAYGIPQALPGTKMASAGADWKTNAATQIEWGLGYIANRYGTPCSAWAHSVDVGWY